MSVTYDTAKFGMMMRDEQRIEAYRRAIHAVVKPGDAVLDIGAGTGILSFLAHQAGATRVVGVEPSDSIWLADAIAKANALDEVRFVQGLSTDLAADAFDVVVSDLRTFTPYTPGHIATILDARERLLRPGGALIATADEVFVAPIEAPRMWESWLGIWKDNPAGLDMSPAMNQMANQWGHYLGGPEELIAAPAPVARLDYNASIDPNFSADVELTARRGGTVHGFSMWFETTHAPGISLSSGPDAPRTAYGRPCFPLLEPITIGDGEAIRLHISARLVRGRYIWRWRGGTASAAFDHSTFFGIDLRPPRAAAESAPTLSRGGERVHWLLGETDGRRTASELAAAVVETFPRDFDSQEDARRWVDDILSQYGE